MMNTKYDQIAGIAYGNCVTCGITLETDEDAARHRTETMRPGQPSHSTRGTNPPREDRIQSMVDRRVQDAIEDALERLQDEVDTGNVTAAEIREALSWYSDFANEWDSEDTR